VGDATNPGSFAFGSPLVLEPIAPQFEIKVAILVDETTQSSAEYHSLAFRSAPNAIVVGSTTAGADGNVSAIPLPGGLRSMFSGIGVFWPDGRPTQRVGIVPDVVAKPTIAGIKAGRDEVLEAAVMKTLGRAPTAAETAALTAE
jgi:C-terminal processing protease CtpA/Prc